MCPLVFRFFQTLAFLALCSHALFAQTVPLFEELSLTPAALNATQHAKYEKLMALTGVDAAYFIQMAPLASVQSGGKLLVKTPGHVCTDMVYYAKEVAYTSEASYSWTGDLYNLCDTCPCNEGYLSFSKTPTGYFGHLIVDATEYQVRDLGGGVQLLLRFNLAEMPGGECGLAGTDARPTDPPTTNSGGCTVRLLVLYDAAAAQADPDVVNAINQAVTDFKTTLTNSGINNYLLNINHVGTLAYSLPTFNLNEPQIDLDQLLTDPTAVLLRNTHQADLLILVTGNDYVLLNPYSNIAGISRVIDPDHSADWALIPDHGFSIVELSSMLIQNALAHEAGHLFAAGHHEPGTSYSLLDGSVDSRTGIPHASDMRLKKKIGPFGTAVTRFTTMHPVQYADTRVMHYSNPSITYKGKVTGIAGRRNNALMIINGACTVANYLSGPDNQLQAQITGDNWGCPDATECLGVHIQGPLPPYQVLWHQSTDGLSWTNPASSGSYCVSVPATVGDRIFVRVQVTSGSTTTTRYHEIESSQGQNGIVCTLRPAPPGTVALTQDGLYPNPSGDGRFQLALPATASGTLEVDVLDVAQRHVFRVVQPVEAGTPPALDFSSLPAGTYVVYTSLAGADPQVHKIFILN